MKEVLRETCLSLVLFANVVFEYVFSSMRNLKINVKNRTLKVMRERESKPTIQSVENKNERRQVVGACQEAMGKPYTLEVYHKVSKNEEEDVDSFQYYNKGFEEALEFYDASENIADEGNEILRVEKLIRREDRNEGEFGQQPIAEVNRSESVDFDLKCGTKCVDMLVKEEKRRKEILNLGWDHGYRMPHQQRKPVSERQQIKCKGGVFNGVDASQQVHKMKGMIEFKGRKEHKTSCEERKHK